jgi:hypothetical protein
VKLCAASHACRLAVEPRSAHGQCQLAAGVALPFWSAAG